MKVCEKGSDKINLSFGKAHLTVMDRMGCKAGGGVLLEGDY